MEATRRAQLVWAFAALALLQLPRPTETYAQLPDRIHTAQLKAGAFAKNVDPESYPVWVSGGIVAAKADRVVDSLYSRSLVIVNEPAHGSADQPSLEAVALCVVDSLGVPAWIVEQAKELVVAQSPLKPHQILISATHTHSAPALMGAHGTPSQDDYAARMPHWIAESILQAYQRRVSARIGYGIANADRFIYCRRWFMEPGRAGGVLFSGREGNIVAMNPGHDSPYKLQQTADVDRTIPILSVQSNDGKPLAVLASFCTHYAGAPALSSDYFGVVARELAHKLRPEDPTSFVGIMANGTSGDANCIDFSRPATPFNYQEVGSYISGRILDGLATIEHGQTAKLDSRLEFITANVRQANPDELQQAKAYVKSKLGDRLPSNIEENYARETVLLSEMPPTRKVPLQALKIGNLAIAGFPTETYNATGLAVRATSPFQVTMNIGLANDLLGYLPPADQFPLGGYTTWRARTSCLEESTEARVVEKLSQLIGELGRQFRETNPNAVPNATAPAIVEHHGPDSAVPAVDSLKHFELFDHQRIELAAYEPLVIDPVAIRFDDSGNMWVVEMSDYPTNPSTEGLGRIRILRDENNDGRFDQATEFHRGLLFPTGLQLHRDGALVTVGGKLVFLRDTDGDSVADTTEDWLGGFAEENPQLRVNDPDFGLDGQLYLANGLRSSKINSRLADNPTSKQTNKTDSLDTNDPFTISISSSDLRWNWMKKNGTPISGPSQFGMSWDRYGNRYFCSNRNPCDAVLIEPWQAAQSPLAGLAPMTSPVLPPGERSTVRPLVSAWTTSNLHSGQFTAACGVLISHSEHLPKASLGNALTCEPTGSLVHRVGLGRVQGRTQAEEPERAKEWLASRDPWFRPVNLEEGPDGGIYVVDMHRAVIEHPDWVPEELKKRPDERWGDQCGRIYRVLAHDAPMVDPIWNQLKDRPLSKRSSADLISLVNHSRTWIQQTASRLLFERISNSNSDELQKLGSELSVACKSLLQPQCSGSGLIRSMYLLQASKPSETPSILETALIDSKLNASWNPAMKAALWRFARDTKIHSETLANTAVERIRSGSREEATQCTWYLAQFNSTLEKEGKSINITTDLLDASVSRSIDLADDPYWLMAITAAVGTELDRFTIKWMDRASNELEQKKMIRTFSSLAWTQLISSIANPSNTRWITARDAWAAKTLTKLSVGLGDDENQRRLIHEPQMHLQLAIARGIAKSSDRKWLADQRTLWEAWASLLGDSRLSPSLRTQLIEILGVSLAPEQSTRCAEAIRIAIEITKDPTIKRQLLASWAQHPEEATSNPSCMDWILDKFDEQTPAMRSTMFQAVRSRTDRLTRWIDALESGKISHKGLDATQIQSLKQVTGDLQPRITKWLAGRIQSDRQKVVDSYIPSLELQADTKRGKQLFAQHCAACHRIDGVGTTVGPDISDSRTQSLSQLLVSILDPNRAIDNSYFRVTIQLNDGTIHDGIVTEESAEHLTLKNQQTLNLVLSKTEIDKIKPSSVSLMPEGIEAQLDQQSMADLIGYIKNWRYVGGQAPSLPQNP